VGWLLAAWIVRSTDVIAGIPVTFNLTDPKSRLILAKAPVLGASLWELDTTTQMLRSYGLVDGVTRCYDVVTT
jgi:hypothetical protein